MTERSPADPASLEAAYESAVRALSESSDDALSKADQEGHLVWDEVVAWADRVRRVVLHERDASSLRSEVPTLGERLEGFLRQVCIPETLDPVATVAAFVRELPDVRERLAEDVEAAFEGDPAAKSFAEIMVAYPSIHAIATYRLAHPLQRLGVPQVPRIMTEHAHARTGIDIHPGARIGRRFFIDHGTGVVIGETTEIGDGVRLYQGVTLGAHLAAPRSRRLRGTKRHPTLE